MLDKQLKTKWLEALRGGEYEQTEGILYRDTFHGKHRMCCLGVLEHICGTPITEMKAYCHLPDDLEERRSPRDVLKSSVPSTLGGTSTYTFEGFLADRNDNGYSFEDIANIIEAYL